MQEFCYTSRVVVHTLGHSTRSFEELVALLDRHSIGTVADVRRFPASRRHPHFTRGALGDALASAGIYYVWLEGLGGRRRGSPDSRHVAWRNSSFRAYADHMETPEFQAELTRLLALARARPTAVLCAEAMPWRCHRQLIADALLARGVDVRHITGPGPGAPHRLTSFARLEDGRVVYDGGQLALTGSRSHVDPP
jgi:uncharacterized protein (DUF488 family)